MMNALEYINNLKLHRTNAYTPAKWKSIFVFLFIVFNINESIATNNTDATTLNVMTQNLLKHTEEDTQNGQGWFDRRNLILSELLAADADIIGVQELKDQELWDEKDQPTIWLRHQLSKRGYAVVAGVQGNAKDIYFRAGIIEKTEEFGSIYLWPDKRADSNYCPASYPSDKIGRNRSATWAKFCVGKCQHNTQKILVINTHLLPKKGRQVAKKIRQKQIQCLRGLAEIKSKNEDGTMIPIIMMGDFNAISTSREIQRLLTPLNTGISLRDTGRKLLGGTLNSFKKDCGNRRIDYVFAAGLGMQADSAQIHPSTPPINLKKWASDHCGYSVEIKVKPII